VIGIPPEKKRRLAALARCTFDNKEMLKKAFKEQKRIDEFQKKEKNKKRE